MCFLLLERRTKWSLSFLSFFSEQQKLHDKRLQESSQTGEKVKNITGRFPGKK